MLEGKFRLSRRKSFSDHRETGEYTSDYIKVLYKDTLDRRRSQYHQRNKSLLELTSLFYVSCWTLNERGGCILSGKLILQMNTAY